MYARFRPMAAITLALALVLLWAGTASAHVTVNPSTATQGGYTKLSFRVPNEKDDADTTQVVVQMPTNHPIASVSIEPKDGWTYEVEKAKLPTPITTDDGQITEAVSTITWSGVLKPGEFTEFDVSVGPLPTDATSLEFKALQTYSDGDVVRWIDTAAAGQPEPEHPAPVLTLTAAADDASTIGASSSSDGTARALGIIGIVVGVLGLGVGGFAIASRRTKPAAD
jgi:periplasmic copper chaperone A